MLNCLNLICARWPETLVDSKTNKPTQKTGGKVCASFTLTFKNVVLVIE